MEKARRRHVPAFGEWNYYSPSSSPDEPEPRPRSGGDWCWYAPEPAACGGDVVWFRYSPSSPHRPRRPAPKKAHRRPEAEVAAPEKLRYGGGGGGKAESVSIVVPVERVRGGPADAAQARPKGARRVVVRPVDEDLYQVPPPDLGASSRPRRKRAARRAMWMGCLGGLSCVA
ncbi:hypothetical protein U9M48_038218 [Paspalum notatum var. saurae]|uniref:Uncharacterized protein n=1 Tax=Paspalum notatum var. saurae TaxID=547442 RepID=A0AAQ3UHK1_PASNO